MRRLPVLGWAIILLTLTWVSAPSRVFAQSPQVIELTNNWALISADKVADSGNVISQASYSTASWYPIHHMPATVLDVLQEDNVYPNLFYGMNLLEEVPQDLYKKDWWYRTKFTLPPTQQTIWLDFPGINYRADIWLNGKLVAGSKTIAGMYVDHRLNVTAYIRSGATNALAVKVTPERAIQGLNGVELADSWFDWINWKYLGYQGPLDVHKLDDSKLAASYVAPGHGTLSSRAAVKVAITSAATTGLTLAATVTSDGAPVTKGAVRFLYDGNPIGTKDVDAKGMATLAMPMPEGISFISDRNAGIWKGVNLSMTGPVKILDAYVKTDLPLPKTNPALLTVYVDVTNGSSRTIRGHLTGEASRAGKPTIRFDQAVSLGAGKTQEVSFASDKFPQLVVHDPDLWWPYTLGRPDLYDLHLQFVSDDRVSDTKSTRFGIRQVTQYRDQDEAFPDVGRGGNFYLKVNGKNLLIRGADYTPNLLFHFDPKREEDEINYVKDMGLNMLRWESKIASEHMVDLADEAGIPVMFGWMCCNQWEKWGQWDAEDSRVAPESLRSQILMLRSHAAVFIWANGSDGYPPKRVRDEYHEVLKDLHWQNAVVDTVSSYTKDKSGNRIWDGILMEGPYSWRPPSYWFSGRYAAAQGSCAEQGDNENVPPLESLAKFIPKDKLWPINDDWFFHAGANEGNNQLLNTRLAVNRRYGPSKDAKEFSWKAQLGLYEDTRAQFEDFAANGWANHKMTLYWMLNSPWPSFFGHLYDYYLKPGGAYYGAKKGLQPVSVVFDYYAAGDHAKAKIRVVNQTLTDRRGLRVRTRVYDLLGRVRYDQSNVNVRVEPQGVALAMTLPRIPNLTSTYFIRCELFDGLKTKIVDNVYWQSTTLDDLGDPKNDGAFELKQASWADFTALNTMPKVQLQLSGKIERSADTPHVAITLRNPSKHIAFFERVTVTDDKGVDEMLPILYTDNYVTVFPGETVHMDAVPQGNNRMGKTVSLNVEGYNTLKELAVAE